MSPSSSGVSLQDQLLRLKAAGITLNPGVSEADLLLFDTKQELEEKPYDGLIAALGSVIEREPFTPVADRLWLCDYERIVDHGDYRSVLERLERMTGNALGITEIRDHVDLQRGEAWVEFSFRGDRVRWDLRVDDDWLDPEILVRYDELLKRSGSAIRLYVNETDYGQSALLGAFGPDEKAVFDSLAKVKMTPIAEQR